MLITGGRHPVQGKYKVRHDFTIRVQISHKVIKEIKDKQKIPHCLLFFFCSALFLVKYYTLPSKGVLNPLKCEEISHQIMTKSHLLTMIRHHVLDQLGQLS